MATTSFDPVARRIGASDLHRLFADDRGVIMILRDSGAVILTPYVARMASHALEVHEQRHPRTRGVEAFPVASAPGTAVVGANPYIAVDPARIERQVAQLEATVGRRMRWIRTKRLLRERWPLIVAALLALGASAAVVR